MTRPLFQIINAGTTPFVPTPPTTGILQFVDSSGLNPLPPGIIVTLTASNGLVSQSGMLQSGGVAPFGLTAGTFTASFVGTQAPTSSVNFQGSTTGTVAVTVPGYQSPVYSKSGYTAATATHLVRNWFIDPSGSSIYPANIGRNAWALLQALNSMLALQDVSLQQTQGAARLQSCVGSQIDSFMLDFFGGAFYRFAQYGETDAQVIARTESIFATPKCTLAGMQAILNVFWPWILLQFGTQNLGVDTGIGGVDTAGGVDTTATSAGGATGVSGTGLAVGVDSYGGADTGQQFVDAPGPGYLPPVPIAFDSQSNPALSMTISPNIVPPYFGVYVKYPNYSDSLIVPTLSPSSILSALVQTWKAAGTVPVYCTNRHS